MASCFTQKNSNGVCFWTLNIGGLISHLSSCGVATVPIADGSRKEADHDGASRRGPEFFSLCIFARILFSTNSVSLSYDTVDAEKVVGTKSIEILFYV